jgi:salicylate hydroxylase
MAIEVAAVLARVMGEGTMETAAQVTAALRRFARLRRRRVTRVQRTAESSGRIYHLSGAMALARDATIKMLGPRRMLARQNWIYDWRS